MTKYTLAFPVWNLKEDGLTKREYFAAMAMNCLQAEYDTKDIDCKITSKNAVKLADALIAELSK